MKTDDLINALSADTGTAEMPSAGAWRYALAASVVLAGVAFFMMLGPRHDIANAAQTLRFLFKFVVTLALAASAWRVVSLLARPERARKADLAILLIAPALLAAAMPMEMMAVPPADWRTRMVGTNSLLCMTFIPLIGLMPLAGFILALRHDAPQNPTLAGAVSGVLAGGVAATFYAAHCFDDSPMFVAVWYTAGIAILAMIGAVAGRMFARW